MNPDAALQFLEDHQPMPGDSEITQDECDVFAELLVHFREHADPRSIPLLVNSVSTSTGMGMYEDISRVLMAHQKSAVVPHIRHGLLQGSDGVKYRCCWWAADVSAWELTDIIEPLTRSDHEDTRDAAKAFIELSTELA